VFYNKVLRQSQARTIAALVDSATGKFCMNKKEINRILVHEYAEKCFQVPQEERVWEERMSTSGEDLPTWIRPQPKQAWARREANKVLMRMITMSELVATIVNLKPDAARGVDNITSVLGFIKLLR
jgi:hypothetical protein